MMRSQYDGKCKTCKNPYQAGDQIEFVKGSGVTRCPSCPESSLKTGKALREAATTIRVAVERIKYSKPDGSFVVIDARFDGPPPNGTPPVKSTFAVKGPLGTLMKGDIVSLTGEWNNDLEWGLQFLASAPASLAVTESDAGLVNFLSRTLPGIGPRRAEAIVRELGGRAAVIAALESDPEKLTVVEGITVENAKLLQQRYQEIGGYKELWMLASEIGLSDSIVNKAIETWGDSAKALIMEDPYILTGLRGVGFVKADEVARKLKMPSTDVRRCAAVALWLMDESTGNGHTWTTLDLLARECEKSLSETGLSKVNIQAGLEHLSKPRTITKRGKAKTMPPAVTFEGSRIYLAEVEFAERSIAETLSRMLSHG